MSPTNQPAKAKPISTPVNRIAYGAFVLLSLYLFITGSYNDSLANLGIALIFDPSIKRCAGIIVRFGNGPGLLSTCCS
ncbi:hypothetical protein [Spirosoma telluris]|uniref:hypothetical protein n=1 Tax=Spirosoma telluris TaxID=2183553 RepID=UPI002FC313FC